MAIIGGIAYFQTYPYRYLWMMVINLKMVIIDIKKIELLYNIHDGFG